jgi:hypothetical protein
MLSAGHSFGTYVNWPTCGVYGPIEIPSNVILWACSLCPFASASLSDGHVRQTASSRKLCITYGRAHHYHGMSLYFTGTCRPGLTIRGAPGAGYAWAPISAPKELNNLFLLVKCGKKVVKKILLYRRAPFHPRGPWRLPSTPYR